jgi:hypothetical protein
VATPRPRSLPCGCEQDRHQPVREGGQGSARYSSVAVATHREPGRPVRAAVSPSHPRVACWAARDERATGQERAVEEADYAPLVLLQLGGQRPRVPRARYLPERLRWPRRRVVDAVERLLGLPGEPADQQQRPRRDVVVGRFIRGVIRRSLAAVEAVAEYGWCRRERLCAGTRPGPGYSTTAVCGAGRR